MRREVILPATPQAALLARSALNDMIPTPVLDGRFEDARVAVSEIVTNALLHGNLPPGRDVIRLVIEADDDAVRVEVEQPELRSPLAPVEPRLATNGMNGFGLLLVDGLADGWGVEPGRPGYVWFEFRRSATHA